MNLQTLQEKVNDSLSGDTLTLTSSYAASETGFNSPDMAEAIATYTPNATLTLTQASQQQTDSPLTVIVRGQSGQFNGQVQMATAVFYLADTATSGIAQMTLTYILPAADWHFVDSFPAFNDDDDESVDVNMIDELIIKTPQLVLVSAEQDQSGNYPTFLQGLTFTGELDFASSPVQAVSWMLDGSQTQRLTGQLTDILDAGRAPTMTLFTDRLFSTISLGSVRLQMKIQVISVYKRASGPDSSEEHFDGVNLYSDIQIGQPPTTADLPLVMPLWNVSNPGLVTFHMDAYDTSFLALSQLSPFLGGESVLQGWPTEIFPTGNQFKIDDFSIIVAPNLQQIASLNMSVQFTDLDWTIIPSLISLQDIWASFMVTDPLGNTAVTTTIQANFIIAREFTLSASISLPQTVIHIALVSGETIPVIATLEHFFGEVTPPTTNPFDFTIVSLDMMADPINRSYQLTSIIEQNWTVDLQVMTLTLQNINLAIDYTQTELSGQFLANAEISLTETSNIDFYLAADKPEGREGWVFAGGMASGSSTSLGDLATAFLPNSWNVTLPDSLQVITLTTLNGSFNTWDSTYSLAAGFGWEMTFNRTTLRIEAAFALASQREDREADPTYSGNVSGNFWVNNLQLTAVYDFQPNSSTVTFKVHFKQSLLTAALTSDTKETVLRVFLGNLNVGEIITYLVDLARPGKRFTLPPPWNALNNLTLNQLALNVNLTTKDVGISVTFNNIKLGFLTLTGLALTYRKKEGKGTVIIAISGSFLGKTYPEKNPLDWDMLDEAPPASPGQGDALLDVTYVGVGQHITFKSGTPTTVTSAIQKLKQSLKPLDDGGQNPLNQPGGSGMAFANNSHFLFGVDFVVMDTVSISAIFNDPSIYGILLSMAGEKAGSFDGLRFELIYRKISNDVGVFSVELRVPKSYRKLELGEVSITLPVIKADIYTDGHFRVDLGFPHKKNGRYNYDDSFEIELFPFLGRGGIYFAYVDQLSSSRVPQITNGNFDPVLELGLGMAIGLGKSISEKVSKLELKLEMSITIEGVFEGIVAWFNPNSRSVRPEMYYWVQGMMAVVGVADGKAGYKSVKASVNLRAEANVSLIIEAYKKIHLKLAFNFKVKVKFSLKITSVKFDFNWKYETTYDIGKNRSTPWIVDPRARSRSLVHHPLPISRSFVRLAPIGQGQQTVLTTAQAPYIKLLNWTPVPSIFSSVQLIPIMLLPMFTPALPSTLFGFDGEEDTPAVQLALTPVVPNQSNGGNSTTAPFNLLFKGMLGWAINAFLGDLSGNITRAELDALRDALDSIDTTENGFSYDDLVNFLQQNYSFQLSSYPSNDLPQTEIDTTLFPIFPPLTYTTDTLTTPVDFSTHQPVTQSYLNHNEVYFEQFDLASDNTAVDPFTAAAETLADITALFDTPSSQNALATVVFRDYFALLVQSAAALGVELLDKYRYPTQPNDSLNTILQSQAPNIYTVRMGDTLLTIADQFGMTLKEISTLNPGVPTVGLLDPDIMPTVLIDTGVSATSLAATNQNIDLNDTLTLSLDEVTTQVQLRDGVAQTLADIQALFSLGSVSDLVLLNADNDSLLQPKQIMAVPEFTYTTSTDDTAVQLTLDFVAAFVTIRNMRGLLDDPNLDWYIQTIVTLNPATDFNRPLTSGDPLRVPPELFNAQEEDAIPYTVRLGDTAVFIAAYLLMIQTRDDELASLKADILATNPNLDFPVPVNTAVQIPSSTRTIFVEDNFDTLSILLVGDTSLVAPFANLNATANILAPLAQLNLPPIPYAVQAGDSLATIAASYNLTIDQLATAVSDTPNLFPTQTEITILDLPQIGIDTLLDQIITVANVDQTAASISRVFVHGLRMPDPTNQAYLDTTLIDIARGKTDPRSRLVWLLRSNGPTIPRPTGRYPKIRY